MTDTVAATDRRRNRIDLVDVARGAALVAMAVYHFTWDLDFHGYVPRGTATEGGWRLFARGIASSFLFLVGVGLVLAHAGGIRWRAFARRVAQVAAGAVAITAVTAIVTPGSFVFFGILHQITVASLVGLLFLRLPPIVSAFCGAAMVAMPAFVQTTLTEPRWLAWIGLAVREPVTNDYVPVFPWTGIVLLGMAAALAIDRNGLWPRLADSNGRLVPLRPLRWLGRHSLLFYLLHQPVLFGLVAGATAISPPDPIARFASDCRHDFRRQLEEPRLGRFCDCLQARLAEDGLLNRLLDGTTTPAENDSVRETSLACSFDIGPADASPLPTP